MHWIIFVDYIYELTYESWKLLTDEAIHMTDVFLLTENVQHVEQHYSSRNEAIVCVI